MPPSGCRPLCSAARSTVRAPQQTLVVEDGLAGVRLAEYLEHVWPHADRKELRRLVRDGLATVNGADAVPNQRLRVGDLVLVAIEGPPAPRRGADAGQARERSFCAEDLQLLAEDESCLIVDKPAGLPCVPDRFGRTAGVHGLLTALRPDDDLRIAHRLDRFTSGCLALAKGLEGARWLDEQLRARTVQKTYLALVDGVLRRDAGTIEKALGPDPRRPGKVMVVQKDARGAREALTEYRVLERFRAHTLVECRPRTGRGHQLRVHLAHLGHPIVADEDYGASGPLRLSDLKHGYKARKGQRERALLDRMFLHAAAIEIPTRSGGILRAESPLPSDLALALEKLRRFAAGAELAAPDD